MQVVRVKDDLGRFTTKPVHATNEAKRFWDKVNVTETCWLWTSALNKQGYAKFHWRGQTREAHRYSYELFSGLIPDGYQIDHLCKVHNCVNPKHLEPVTAQENMRRSDAGLYHGSKTHCPRGHEYSLTNTYIGKSGSRFCRKCRYIRNRAYLARVKGRM